MADLDPRLFPFRPDMAADFLQGKVKAERFVKGTPFQVATFKAPLCKQKNHPGRETELLWGETFVVYEQSGDGWCWGQSETDGYVGYTELRFLLQKGVSPTHWVNQPATYIYSDPEIKSAVVEQLPYLAPVALAKREGSFARLVSGGWVFADHLMPLGNYADNFLSEAVKFLHAPYLWGGRTYQGLDCSSLVQLALGACGKKSPRDSDMQLKSMGTEIAADQTKPGDLLFYRGHVAIVWDPHTVLHASAGKMCVYYEPLAEVRARYNAASFEVAKRVL